MFIDAEARMDTYEDKDGVKRTQLNLLMRKSSLCYRCPVPHTIRRQLRSALTPTDVQQHRHRYPI